MKFSVSLFVLILGPFSVIKPVLSINCYNVLPHAPCDSELKAAKESRENKDHAFSEYFTCKRLNMTQGQQDKPCGKTSTECATLTYELKDETQLMIKVCEQSDHSVCKNFKSMYDEDYEFTKFVKNSNCDFCTSDKCNDKTPNDKSTLPAPPQKEKPSDASLPEQKPSTLSLKCQISDDVSDTYADNCMEKIVFVKNKDQAKSKLFACFRESIIEKDTLCSANTTVCTTLVYELNDQTEMLFKFCDNSTHSNNCNKRKKEFDKELELFDFVKRSYCDSCSSDYCNKRTPKNKPSLPPPPRKEKLSASLSAVSTPPSAAAVFIIVSVIHILL